MTTLKIKYEFESLEDRVLFKKYLQQFASGLHFIYNRLREGDDIKDLHKQLKNLNNIELLDSWFIENLFKNADTLLKRENLKETKHAIIFGGKANFSRRMKGLISKEEWQELRLGTLSIVGEANKKGNRKFRIENDLQHILFKPFKKFNNIHLKLPRLKKSIAKTLTKLYKLQEAYEIPITWKADLNYVYITFDETVVYGKQEVRRFIRNRILAVDLNPNYIGWSVVDWKTERDFNVVKTGCFSLKDLNDQQLALKLTRKQRKNLSRKKRKELSARAKIKNEYFSNKRKFETIEIVKALVIAAKHYNCEIISCEDLNIKSSDKEHKKRFNRLCNSFFIRNIFTNNLQKRCNIEGIHLVKVVPQYSSFVGNFLFRSLELPDPILASIEIGRRGVEFKQHYLDKSKDESRNIVQPDLKKFDDLVTKSLEEFGLARESFKDLISLYYVFNKKDSKMMYRVPFRSNEKWSKPKTRKSYVSKLDRKQSNSQTWVHSISRISQAIDRSEKCQDKENK